MALVAVVVTAGYATLNQKATPTKPTVLRVVATFYPLYDFAFNVVGDHANVTVLVPETLDVHDFDPTPGDLQRVAEADVLVYNGAGLEPWVPSLIKAAGKPMLVVVDASEGIPLLQVSPQFQRGNRTVDPHLWLDPVDARAQVMNIAKGLSNADPTNADAYSANAAAYIARLEALDAEIRVNTTDTKARLFVTFHEAFAYFARRYNLTQIPIQGPFQEEPTPSDIQRIVDTIRQYHLRYVGYESLENPAIPETIATQTDATLVLMDPIEGLTSSDRAAGLDYLALMHINARNIVEALNGVG
jgi:zinc transport system substrate-binding protein